MLKVLINSYTCCPNMGSEQGMGWNWIVNLARYCEVFVISEGEYKEKVEEWLEGERVKVKNEQLAFDDPRNFAERMHFYWNPVSPEVRKMCWNQGDWRFYKYYKEWQKKTADIARQIIKEQSVSSPSQPISILHQLNMIGFREPGYLWKVSQETGIPFVWGPVGGMKQFPMAYTDGGGLKMKVFNYLKNVINIYQIKHDKRVKAAINQASALISSIPDSYNAIKKYHGKESVIIPETGCSLAALEPTSNQAKRLTSNLSTFSILWVGKFDFRKRLDVALRAVARSNRDVKLHVYGTGTEEQVRNAKEHVRGLEIEDKVKFMGNRPNYEVNEAMRNADLFLFTSVSEDTSTVVLEAVSNGLPVLCFDACGMAAVIDDKVGRRIPLSNPDKSAFDFAEQIRYFYDNREELSKCAEGCMFRAEELSWETKVVKVIHIYEKVIKSRKV